MPTINVSDIIIKNGAPWDEYLIELLKKAYKGEIQCYIAVLNIEGIKPFSDYKPEISEKDREHFGQDLSEEKFPQIFVYPKSNMFIMSDNYNTYYLYKDKGIKQVLCVILGEAESPFILDKGKPFKLPPPTLEVTEK